MSEGLHSIILPVPIRTVWGFVSSINRWAPLVPGYINHEMINDGTLIWEFKSDLGLMKKKIKLEVNILEWNEPDKVTFKLKGLNEKFEGHGYFLAEQCSSGQTKMTGCLAITAKGAKAPIVNALLKTYVPQMIIEFSEAIAQSLLVQK
ncbi:SRPBCC family protein [Peribacillus simplex]|uniref:SRPBCC family protein n=1 Tax=Peribacillus simplex TaxID=1478 RepID=A0AAW7INS6_9BACI|nr:SRPBCC family protein [Peribacillus simplex]AMM93361.1 carbon monoxide dehydrogenase [Peribacillus simplex]MDM5294467.1 SRPBCC family protein [Peribacillus simplex]MDM5453416.1 SRPBCC family protein [Peribacillus simplex]